MFGLCSVKERVHAFQRYEYSPFTQSKKGSILFNGINQSLYSIKERVHAIQRCQFSLFTQSKKGSILFNGINSVSLLNQRKGPYYSTVSIQSLCSIKERVHTIQRYQFSLFAQSKKGSILFNGINSVSLLNQRKGPYYSTVSIQSLCSIKERVHTIQRYQFSLFAQSKKGSILFNGINSVSLLNQRKGPYYSTVSIQSLYSIKERVHTIQRYQFSLFAQSKKGSILFNGINSVSLLNQRKGPYYSTVSIQSLYSIKERVHTIQRYQFSLFTQ